MLQLHKTDDGTEEYAEFLHLPKKQFTDFGMYLNIYVYLCYVYQCMFVLLQVCFS